MRLSIIVPCWKDRGLTARQTALWRTYPGADEILVSAVRGEDPAEDAAWATELEQLGARLVWNERPNRGGQLNAGARAVTGDILLFQHADSRLERGHLFAIRLCLGQAGNCAGGAFYRKFDSRHPRLRVLEIVERIRCWAGGPLFGDQSIFVRAGAFAELGGYREIPLMEDWDFSRRLRRHSQILLLDPPMETSPRLSEQKGAWRATLRNALFIMLFQLGYCPWRLHAMYYGTSPARMR